MNFAVTQLVEALCHKSEGRGFDSRWSHCNFSLTSFRPHCGPWVDSAANRNEYQEYFLVGKGSRCVADNLTTFKCRLSWNVRVSTSWNPQGLSRLVMGLLYLYIWIYWRPLKCSYWNTSCVFKGVSNTATYHMFLIWLLGFQIWVLACI
jgi:hypothetical protein